MPLQRLCICSKRIEKWLEEWFSSGHVEHRSEQVRVCRCLSALCDSRITLPRSECPPPDSVFLDCLARCRRWNARSMCFGHHGLACTIGEQRYFVCGACEFHVGTKGARAGSGRTVTFPKPAMCTQCTHPCLRSMCLSIYPRTISGTWLSSLSWCVLYCALVCFRARSGLDPPCLSMFATVMQIVQICAGSLYSWVSTMCWLCSGAAAAAIGFCILGADHFTWGACRR